MTPSLETILKRMEQTGHSETTLVSEFVSDMICYQGDASDDELAVSIDASMDEIIAAAKIVKAWAQKGVPA